MARYEQNAARWEKQLAAADVGIARTKRKISEADDRLKGLKDRLAAQEADRANYLRALGRDDQAKGGK